MNMVACGVRVEACKICGHSRHIGHLSPCSYSVSGARFTITSVAAPGSAQLCVPLGPGNTHTDHANPLGTRRRLSTAVLYSTQPLSRLRHSFKIH